MKDKINPYTMPLVFVGHGNPMIALADNAITKNWRALGEQIGRPRAILAISAHWYGGSHRIQNAPKPKQIYDMYGFPKALYDLKYEPSGCADLSARVEALFKAAGEALEVDNSWGIDHGMWSVLVHLYPEADVPVVQLSIKMDASAEELQRVGDLLRPLRDEGYLIVGSGNIVHNLRQVDWDNPGGSAECQGFDAWVRTCMEARDFEALRQYKKQALAAYAVPTPDHFLPLLYLLGMVDEDDQIMSFNELLELASLSMTSFLIGKTKPAEES